MLSILLILALFLNLLLPCNCSGSMATWIWDEESLLFSERNCLLEGIAESIKDYEVGDAYGKDTILQLVSNQIIRLAFIQSSLVKDESLMSLLMIEHDSLPWFDFIEAKVAGVEEACSSREAVSEKLYLLYKDLVQNHDLLNEIHFINEIKAIFLNYYKTQLKVGNAYFNLEADEKQGFVPSKQLQGTEEAALICLKSMESWLKKVEKVC